MIKAAMVSVALLGASLATAQVRPEAPVSAAGEKGLATLEGGSTVGLIPLSNPAAAKSLGQFIDGFFREEDAKVPVSVSAEALRLVKVLPRLRAAGASHIVALCYEGEGEADYVRFFCLGDFTEEGVAALRKEGLGRLDNGVFDLVAFKDGQPMPAGGGMPPLPVVRLTQMARQLAAETDCSVDTISLASKDAAESLDEALRQAFAEEGELLAKVELPARARQLTAQLAGLRSLGARQLVVTSFQTARGSDIVLLSAKGVFAPEAQAKARSQFGARSATESSIVLARWVDGEERGAVEAPGRRLPRVGGK